MIIIQEEEWDKEALLETTNIPGLTEKLSLCTLLVTTRVVSRCLKLFMKMNIHQLLNMPRVFLKTI